MAEFFVSTEAGRLLALPVIFRFARAARSNSSFETACAVTVAGLVVVGVVVGTGLVVAAGRAAGLFGAGGAGFAGAGGDGGVIGGVEGNPVFGLIVMLRSRLCREHN